MPIRSSSRESDVRGRALITGATGGIGEVFAKQLAERGYSLVLVARTRSRLEQLAGEIRQAHGVDVDVLDGDLSCAEGLGRVEERVASDSDLTLLVNCAGFAPWGRFCELDFQREEQTIRLNVVATMRLTRAALTGMLERGHGGIINVSSLACFIPLPFCSTYGGTKAYITNFTEALHEELRGSGVTVQALCPGFTRTGLFEREGADVEKIPALAWVSAETVVGSSLAALKRKRAICIPGLRYRLLAFLFRFVPRSQLRRRVASLFGKFDSYRLQKDASGSESVKPKESSDKSGHPS
jgi:short-subunit dehydrogenase